MFFSHKAKLYASVPLLLESAGIEISHPKLEPHCIGGRSAFRGRIENVFNKTSLPD